MRVCQPSPVALNTSTISVSYRIVSLVFGFSRAGRPMRCGVSPFANCPSHQAAFGPAREASENHVRG